MWYFYVEEVRDDTEGIKAAEVSVAARKKKSAVFQEIILVEQKREGEEGGERLPNSSCLLKVPTFVCPHKKWKPN